ncbi:MAG: hypothetical protein WCG20_03095 [bacterium]
MNRMKNQLPVFKNKELNQFALYCKEQFTSIDAKFTSIDAKFISIDERFIAIENRLDNHDKKLDIIMETLAEILEKLNQLTDVFGKTRADVIDLQYRVTQLESK